MEKKILQKIYKNNYRVDNNQINWKQYYFLINIITKIILFFFDAIINKKVLIYILIRKIKSSSFF